jgi:hypothetical protein
MADASLSLYIFTGFLEPGTEDIIYPVKNRAVAIAGSKIDAIEQIVANFTALCHQQAIEDNDPEHTQSENFRELIAGYRQQMANVEPAVYPLNQPMGLLINY